MNSLHSPYLLCSNILPGLQLAGYVQLGDICLVESIEAYLSQFPLGDLCPPFFLTILAKLKLQNYNMVCGMH